MNCIDEISSRIFRHNCLWLNAAWRSSLVLSIFFIVQYSVDYGWTQHNLTPDEHFQDQKIPFDTLLPVGNMTTCLSKNPNNPWASFLPGTWVLRRTNTLHTAPNSAGNNVTDTLLTLEAIDEGGIRLCQETAIGISNTAFTPEPKQVLLDFHLQPCSEGVDIEQLQPQTVLVARRQIVCRVLRYTQTTGDQKKSTTLWFSDTVMPYLFRSEEIRSNISLAADHPETVLSHTIMAVTDTSGVRLFKNLLSDYKTQTIKKTATGTVISQASHSMNIPGGLLRDVTVETDTANQVIGRSVTSVIDYYVACPGVPVRQRRLYSEASKEIQTNWDNIPNLDSGKSLE